MVITKLNVTYNVNDAADYFNQIATEKYDHLKWSMLEDKNSDSTILNVYGWAIQYPKDFIGLSYGLYSTYELGIENYQDSEIAFGFAKKVLDTFPLAFRATMYVNPPGTHFLPHIDSTHAFRIHIPILSNPNAIWITKDGTTNMIPGNAYLLDSSNTHETMNNGITDRVHIELEMRRNDVHTISKYLSDQSLESCEILL